MNKTYKNFLMMQQNSEGSATDVEGESEEEEEEVVGERAAAREQLAVADGQLSAADRQLAFDDGQLEEQQITSLDPPKEFAQVPVVCSRLAVSLGIGSKNSLAYGF